MKKFPKTVYIRWSEDPDVDPPYLLSLMCVTLDR